MGAAFRYRWDQHKLWVWLACTGVAATTGTEILLALSILSPRWAWFRLGAASATLGLFLPVIVTGMRALARRLRENPFQPRILLHVGLAAVSWLLLAGYVLMRADAGQQSPLNEDWSYSLLVMCLFVATWLVGRRLVPTRNPGVNRKISLD